MEDLSKLGRKEREKLQRKLEIQQAATKLFAEKGFSNTTLEDIAASAEFGIGTIYNYFQSKEEIFRSIIERLFDANLEITIATDQETESLIEFFKLYTERVFRYFLQNKNALLLLVAYFTSNGDGPVNLHTEKFETMHCELNDLMISRIKKGISNGEIREVNAENLFFFFHSVIFPYVTRLIKLNKLNEFNVDEHAEFVLDVLFNGIIIKQA